MLFMRFRSRDALLLMDFLVPSSSRRGDQEGSHGVERRDIEAFRAYVDLVRPRRGVTSASLDRGHVEGLRRRGYPPPYGVHRTVVHPQVLDHHRSMHTHRPITACWSGAPAKDPPSRTCAAPRREHHSGPYAPALRIVTIYSAPTRMPSLRARRTHQPIQGSTSGKCSCRLSVTRSGESNADARVASQIAATLTSGTQVSQ